MARRRTMSMTKGKALSMTHISPQEFSQYNSENISYDGLVKVYFSGATKKYILALISAGYDFQLQGTTNDIMQRVTLCRNNVKMAVLSKNMDMSLGELKKLTDNGVTYDELVVMAELSQ